MEQQQQQQQQDASTGAATSEHNAPQPQQAYQPADADEIVQVVYEASGINGSLVGIDASLLATNHISYESTSFGQGATSVDTPGAYRLPQQLVDEAAVQYHEHAAAHTNVSRSASTLPAVAEETLISFANQDYGQNQPTSLESDASTIPVRQQQQQSDYSCPTPSTVYANSDQGQEQAPYSSLTFEQQQQQPYYEATQNNGDETASNYNANIALYATVNKPNSGDHLTSLANAEKSAEVQHADQQQADWLQLSSGEGKENEPQNEEEETTNFTRTLSRNKQGAAESGSFKKGNFRKTTPLDGAINNNVASATADSELNVHRQRLLQTQDSAQHLQSHRPVSTSGPSASADPQQQHLSGSKFKRTHSVSFNVRGSRNSRHSVDIRNLPSYLTIGNKSTRRGSIMDAARGAMSSLVHSLSGGGGGGGSSASSVAGAGRRDSSPDDEPIFEEPIAPTLSLGQRVAMINAGGSEFGTVGWIGQLADVHDDWVVGVIFDNMIGDCDGAHNGVRYFYARQNYAMFVPLSAVTKTDNYVGRPETGTMLSRMSISLKPGQLISIQRSSIRLQHCFLNAPHQRVGHDVRAVSNRLHCQCHNCGPCAHLSKQGRPSALPAYGPHHVSKKKNSLAHAAVEILAHHHHHIDEHEEHDDDEDYEFGDNAAHACNFVRYSCCQQNGIGGHDFSADCGMVRPELLDNLIHAPRAPHRRSRPRRRVRQTVQQTQQQLHQVTMHQSQADQMSAADAKAIEASADAQQTNMQSNYSTLEQQTGGTYKSSTYMSETVTSITETDARSHSSYSPSSASSSTSSSSPSGSPRSASPPERHGPVTGPTGVWNPSYPLHNSAYNTIDTQISLMDQKRYIYQRDSSAFMQNPSFEDGDNNNNNDDNDDLYAPRGLGSRLRRCFCCLMRGARPPTQASRRPKKRKISHRNRALEYRRRQSTFVPSTLAKPQEDFASHGIVLGAPGTSGAGGAYQQYARSDYSSCSRSSGASSRSNSPAPAAGWSANSHNAAAAAAEQQEFGTTMGNDNNEQGLKTSNIECCLDCCVPPSLPPQYHDDSIGAQHSDVGSHKKLSEESYESAYTSAGYFDTLNSSSNDTLKHIVDTSINEQVAQPEPLAFEPSNVVSPVTTSSCDNSFQHEQVDVSSPTASVVSSQVHRDADQDDACELAQQLDELQFDSDRSERDQ